MRIEIGPLLRKVMVAAGLPLLPAGCDPLPPPIVPVGDGCVGGWGANKQEGGCRSGPYTTTHDKYLLIEPGNADHLALYQQCLAGMSCPEQLCLALINYQPKTGAYWAEHFEALTTCAPACQDGNPGVHVVYTLRGSCAGRRPEGLADAEPVAAATALGAYFAQAARLEAASVPAFARLAQELTAHGAPGTLVAAAHRALFEEIHHFQVTRALAHRFGAAAKAPAVPGGPVRPLEEIACENAVEGCVGETLGAAVAGWQAAAAADPAVRAAMPGIARDEAGHATLAWQVDAWARTRLSPAARRRLDEARERGVDALEASVAAAPVADEVSRQAGVPAADTQLALIAGLRAGLWRAPSA